MKRIAGESGVILGSIAAVVLACADPGPIEAERRAYEAERVRLQATALEAEPYRARRTDGHLRRYYDPEGQVVCYASPHGLDCIPVAERPSWAVVER